MANKERERERDNSIDKYWTISNLENEMWAKISLAHCGQ